MGCGVYWLTNQACHKGPEANPNDIFDELSYDNQRCFRFSPSATMADDCRILDETISRYPTEKNTVCSSANTEAYIFCANTNNQKYIANSRHLMCTVQLQNKVDFPKSKFQKGNVLYKDPKVFRTCLRDFVLVFLAYYGTIFLMYLFLKRMSW